jgi:membrane-bound lytic murein transglycosylase D
VPLIRPDASQRLVYFEVTRATTPRGLGEVFGVAWDSVVAWNDLDPQARLQTGQLLQLVVPRSFSAQTARVDLYEANQVDVVTRGSREHIEAALRERGLLRRGYKVRKGEDLTKIGKKFDLSDGDLGRINNFSRDHQPEPGTTLVVYVAKGKERGTTDAPPPRSGSNVATPAAEPTDLPTSATVDERQDIDPEPGPGIMQDDAAAGPSTEATAKLPGQQGWTRKRTSKPGKTSKPRTGGKK